MFSIVVPVFNTGSSLNRCIDSVIAQTYPNWELILVDDGSTDQSGMVCDEYAKKDGRIRVFHVTNGGVSRARNIGLNHANGEWVTFCDSDDEMFPNALQCYSEAMTPDVDLIRGGFERFRQEGANNVVSESFVTSNKAQILIACSETRYEGYIWNSCFRREKFKNCRFQEDISWCEDHLFVYSLIKFSRKVAFISDVVYRYYVPITKKGYNDNNLSSRILDPDMIMRGAKLELELKQSSVGHCSEKLKHIIYNDFKYKANLALRFSIYRNNYIKAIEITFNHLKCNVLPMIKFAYYIKLQN